MSKSEKKGNYQSFREFHDEYGDDTTRKKNMLDNKGERIKVRDKLRKLNPKNFNEDDFDYDLYNR